MPEHTALSERRLLAAAPAHRTFIHTRLFPYVVAGVAYLLLALVAYNSFAIHLASAIPGRGEYEDFAIFHWNLWWFQHAVFQLGRDPFFTDYIFFPLTVNLAYHTLTPFLDIVALPIYAAFGPTAAINAVIIGSLVFSATTTFAYLRHHSVTAGPAFLGGALYTFSSFVTMRVSVVHFNIMPIGWLPLSLLLWERLVERRTLASALVLGSVLYAAFMTDQQFGIWLAFLLMPYTIFRMVRSQRSAHRRIVALGLAAVAALGGLMSIAPLPQWVAGRDADYPTTPLSVIQYRYSIHLEDVIAWPPRYVDAERVTLGVILPAGVALGLARGRRDANAVYWLVAAAAYLLLALGPVFEPLNLPLPYQLFHQVTGGLYRVPARFILLTVFALIVFVALSLRADYARLSQTRRLAVIAGALLLLAVENRWYEPFPAFTMPDYRIYHAIGDEPGDYLLLEIPVGPHNSADHIFGHGGVLQYYAPVHHKRLINGAVARLPAHLTDYYRQWSLLAALAEEGPLPDVDSARGEFEMLSREWDARYVLLHRDMLSPDTATWAAGFFNTQDGWCLVDEEGPLLAYRRASNELCPIASRPLPPDGTLNLGDGGDERYLGPGWYYAENIGGPQARWTGREPMATLRLTLAQRDYHVTLRVASYAPNQTVTVSANDRRIAEVSISEGWGEYTFDLPEAMIAPDGTLVLTFAHTQTESAYARTGGQSDDRRPLAVAYDAISLNEAR
jgi:hypothetical protein